jgi:nucleoside-diphosphate-sugar epimerase
VKSAPSSVLIVGCGYVGLPLARHFNASGWQVIGLTGSEESAVRLSSEPYPILGLDITTSLDRLQPRTFDFVIHCASSGRRGAEAYEGLFLSGTRNLLSALTVNHFLFVSSTSVYGQTDGSWVTEESPADPSRQTGQVLRAAEEIVLEQQGAVARLAGIYGPGRCVPLRKLLDQTAIIEGQGERIMNLIHRDDAVSALVFLGEHGLTGIYNVTDNEPVSQLDWFRYVCGQLDRPLPPFGPRDLARKRGWTSKRVSNQRLRQAGWSPRIKTFREGLDPLLGPVKSQS